MKEFKLLIIKIQMLDDYNYPQVDKRGGCVHIQLFWSKCMDVILHMQLDKEWNFHGNQCLPHWPYYATNILPYSLTYPDFQAGWKCWPFIFLILSNSVLFMNKYLKRKYWRQFSPYLLLKILINAWLLEELKSTLSGCSTDNCCSMRRKQHPSPGYVCHHVFATIIKLRYWKWSQRNLPSLRWPTCSSFPQCKTYILNM